MTIIARDYAQNPIKKEETYYQILGLNPDATILEIKTAFRKISLINHPDKQEIKNAAQTDDYLKIVNLYEILCDEQLRAAYDRELADKQFNFKPQPKAEEPQPKAEDVLQKEEWFLFEKFARELLSIINPLKQHIFLGPSGGISYADLYRNTSFEMGAASRKNTPYNLNIYERKEFVAFILFMEKQLSPPASAASTALGFSKPKSLNPEHDDTMVYGRQLHCRLRYSTPVIKELIRLYKAQENDLNKLFNEYSNILNYKLYFEKITQEQFSSVDLAIKYEDGELFFNFYPKVFKNLTSEEADKEWDNFQNWIKPYNPTALRAKSLRISPAVLISKLDKANISIDEVVKLEKEKRVINHSIEVIKDHFEAGISGDVIDEELNKLAKKGIKFHQVEQMTAEKNKALCS